MLCETALESKALDYKTGELGAEQIIDALNYANRATADYEGMRRMDELRELAGSELALRVYLSRLGDVQAIIDRTRNRPPICVAVVGEEITMMGEVIRELEKSYPNYPLAGTKRLYCILGIDALERAVEVAAKSGNKLGDLLEEYVSEAAINRPDTPSVDEFGGGIDLEDTFAVSFFRDRLVRAQSARGAQG